MIDLLDAQAEIKARYHPKTKQPRDGGRYVNAADAERICAEATFRRQALTEELIAKGLMPKKAPPGCTMVKAHPRHVHGYHPPVSDNGEGERVVETLFDRVAA